MGVGDQGKPQARDLRFRECTLGRLSREWSKSGQNAFNPITRVNSERGQRSTQAPDLWVCERRRVGLSRERTKWGRKALHPTTHVNPAIGRGGPQGFDRCMLGEMHHVGARWHRLAREVPHAGAPPRWLAHETVQAGAWSRWRHAGLQGKPCRLVRGYGPDALACTQNPASWCADALPTHWLARKTLQAGA